MHAFFLGKHLFECTKSTNMVMLLSYMNTFLQYLNNFFCEVKQKYTQQRSMSNALRTH